MGLIPANLRPALDALQVDVAVAALRDAIKDGWSYYNMSAGVVDGFNDQTGIASLGAASCAVGALSNAGAPSTSYANAGGTGNRTGSITATTGGSWFAVPNASYTVDGANTGGAGVMPYSGGSVAGAYLRYDFGSAKYVSEIKEYFNAAGSSGTQWKWQGSNDASAWTDLTGSLSWAQGSTTTTTTITGSIGPWRYLQKIGVSGTGDGTGWMQEAEFKIGAGAGAPAAVTVSSIAFPAGLTPIECRLVSPVALGGGAAGTDCLFDVSRDGSTWGAVSLGDLGKYDASTRILGGLVNLSGQPAGTNLYWRWRTTNSYTVTSKGVVLQWR